MSLLLHRAGLVQIPPVAITSTDNATANTSGGVATFTDRAIGVAAPDRWVYVAISAEDNNDISACSIGGVAGELVAGPIRNTAATPDNGVAIYRRRVTSGTTATITVTCGSGTAAIGISVFRVVGGRGLVFDSDAAASASVSIDIPDRGGCIAVSSSNGTTSSTWTNASEATDFTVGSDNHSAAITTTPGTGVSIGGGNAGATAMAAVSFS